MNTINDNFGEPRVLLTNTKTKEKKRDGYKTRIKMKKKEKRKHKITFFFLNHLSGNTTWNIVGPT